MFAPLPSPVRFPQLEEEVLLFWKERGIYQRSLELRRDAPRFVFYEGPPTANGLPHPGHCLTRAIKDLFPRYRTMRGYLCERKAGWDTHGLPVEVEVCKELGIHSKEDIEAYGVEPFIQKCLQSVFRYTQQWEQLTERLGFWVDLDAAYVTYHESFIESVWWALKNLFDRGLLYQGHKIVWWWAQGGTALSAGEVDQGYRDVADPSVYVRFPLLSPDGTPTDEDLLVWTTTPWTLPSNQFAAVHQDLEYVLARGGDSPRALIVAAALWDSVKEKLGGAWTVESSLTGAELIGRRYVPPFDYYYREQHALTGRLADGTQQVRAWRVLHGDFVTTDSGAGVVHIAPAFGEADFQLLRNEQQRFAADAPELICAVGPDGKFTSDAPEYVGRFVKDADRDITRELRRRGLLAHQEQYVHRYPFCWRADKDPLIQYPRKSWFVRTTLFRDQMLANNEQIRWLPEHIQHGRFGNFLEHNVDWALSRERYWGTPLPIWVCEATGRMQAVGSYAELQAKPGAAGFEVWAQAKAAQPELSDHLRVHKPYIDAVTYDSPFRPGARMRRVGEVIDCWFDSGAMPFAQWGYPHRGREDFARQFPADFISEAIDQTRGWFYSQLAISTLLFGEEPAGAPANATTREDRPRQPWPHPFRNCIVLGLMLGEDGEKMSKSKRNYREPNEIFQKYGADALRWYFYANQAPWTSIRYKEEAIRTSVPEFLLRLWNVYAFFVIYAGIDGFEPEKRCPAGKPAEPAAGRGDFQLSGTELAGFRGCRPVEERSELDRWILAELSDALSVVVARMDAYDNFAAGERITAFVDALSNWYLRRSRDRFWAAGDLRGLQDRPDAQDKLDAYWTLYECLLTTTKLVAPFVPFLAETMWRNLAVEPFGADVPESVHLCDYPVPTPADDPAETAALTRRMSLVRELVSLGRSARTSAALKVRQPLSKVEVILSDMTDASWLEAHRALIADELNVKAVEFAPRADEYVQYTILPDLKRLGPKLGKQLPAVKAALASADGAVLLAQLQAAGTVSLSLPGGAAVELAGDDIQVRLQAKPGWAAAHSAVGVVVLSTHVSAELQAEGLAREIVHAVQAARKDVGCEFTDRIRLALVSPDADVAAAVAAFADYVKAETLCSELTTAPLPGVEPVAVSLGDGGLQVYVQRIAPAS